MAKLGTKERPAIVRVENEERAAEILQICTEHGWEVIIGVESDQEENISDVRKLLGRLAPAPDPAVRYRPVSGNDYCPCGSGLKYKTCCMLKQPQ